MKLYSYVVARDYGFAPNPFYGLCSLATCKPRIRSAAQIGDLVLGTGSKTKGREGHVVFVMRVTEAMPFDQYWNDPRFVDKRPNLRGSKKQAFGDNIYHRSADGSWHQEDSHHSFSDGSLNQANVANDTQVDRILLSTEFVYWGGSGPLLPERFRDAAGQDICALRNHKCVFPSELVESFAAWFESMSERGYLGDPLDWQRSP